MQRVDQLVVEVGPRAADIGNQDGIDFLVMEFLDGETVAQRLEKGALPLDQALTIAIDEVQRRN